MNKGIIIHLDDDHNILNDSLSTAQQIGIDLELIQCKSKEEFNNAIGVHQKDLKVLIFDLLDKDPGSEQLSDLQAAFLNYIEDNFSKYNLPIFIYSGYLQAVEKKFTNCATVFKIDKEKGLFPVYEKIKQFQDSGFLEVFAPGGILETDLKKEIHQSFTCQFRPGEIERIIESTKTEDAEQSRKRSITVFKRIAVRSLMFDLIAPVVEGDTVNPIEHYYRRSSKVEYWTGDIWQQKDDADKYVMLLSPRCDIALAKVDQLLVCQIDNIDKEINGLAAKKDRKLDQLQKWLRDNIEGKAQRHLPKSPVFIGGKIDLSKHRTIPKADLKSYYDYVVTLSDDLTNEILGKFAYYFLRTGINTISVEEFNAYIELLKGDS